MSVQVGCAWGWSLVSLVGEGESLITSGKMQGGYATYVWCRARKSLHFCTKEPKKQQLRVIG